MDKHLHILSLDVPYPPDFGGMYDLYYKLEALQNEGIKIHLHCFQKEREEQTELNKYCIEVFYYQRQTGLSGIDTNLPYIVASRNSETLLQRLLEDDYPILMEGVHCTFLTTDKRFNHRKKFVRLHNVEQHYYQELYNSSSSFFKRIYYRKEAELLKKYESRLAANATAFWTVTPADATFYQNELHAHNVVYLPLFLPNWKTNVTAGMGTYCLYHGNLSVAENEYAACWLLKNVFNKINIPLVIAGKNPSKKLEKLAHKKMHTCLVENPSEKQMQDMIEKAHLNILPSFSKTGIKLKLINALFNGKHCIVNENMLSGTNLDATCHIANSAESIQQLISQIYNQPFTDDEIKLRKTLLNNEFNNEAGAKKIVEWIWGNMNF